MPSAIQFGMSLDEFWHGDMRLLEAYKKAYYRNVSFNAWKIGDYMRLAVFKGVMNALATKKSQQNWDWVEFKDPIEKIVKPKITKGNLEVEFRKRQAQDKAFVQRLLHRS